MAKSSYSRLRRLRLNPQLRGVVKETVLSPSDFIYPLFVTYGKGTKSAIEAMPDCYQISVDQLASEISEITELGISGVILFGIPNIKDDRGSGAYDSKGVIPQAIKAIKQVNPELLVITDVCLCGYTNNGHCGVFKNKDIDNDATVDILGKVALSHVEAGADMVAPSAMMDGQVFGIRQSLDENGYKEIPIMSYSAKYASAFYRPFRGAAKSHPKFGSRNTYQLDPGSIRMALREVEEDIQEGADIVMIKPALGYLDVIAKVKHQFRHPVAAFNVSGEYSMVKAAAYNGWIDENDIVLEILGCIKRAGADLILSYHAKQVSRLLNSK